MLLLFLGAGCQKDETIPNPKVECSFFLLNQTGSPDTIFAEGENFTFCFKIETDDPEWRFNGFQLKTSNFFRVYRIENDIYYNFGTPFKSMSCAGAFYACGHETPFVFVLPWLTGLRGNEFPDLDSYPPFCLFTETDTLPKGQYATFLINKLNSSGVQNIWVTVTMNAFFI